MKKIFAMLTVTVPISIILFGFVNRKQTSTLNAQEPNPMVRFIIEDSEHASENLQAQVRVVSTRTGKTVYDHLAHLTRENGKYVTAPLPLDTGNYRVEAIAYSAGTRTTFTNNHVFIIPDRK